MEKTIVIGIPCLLNGGSEKQTLNLVRICKSLKFRVIVVSYFEHDSLIVDEFIESGAEVRKLSLKRGISAPNLIAKLRREFLTYKPELIHIQYLAPGALPIIAARLARVKTIFATVHQPFTPTYGILSKFMLRSASFLTTKFIAVSQNAEKSWFGSSNIFDENKPLRLQPHHFTIYNAVNIDRICEIITHFDKRSLRGQLNIEKNLPLIGIVSRLRYEKGADLLVNAFNLLLKSGLDAHLLIVGTGPDENKLVNLSKNHGISGKITFYGPASWEQAIKLISIMDIVVVPSRFEGFGLTAAEAMACGKPVLASDNFGLLELIRDQETGLTFKTGDYKDLKDKLTILLNSSEICDKIGRTGQNKITDQFDISIYQKKIASLYENYS